MRPTRTILARLTLPLTVAAAFLGTMASPALAATCPSPSTGVYYYDAANCGTLILHDIKTSDSDSSGGGSISSLWLSPAPGQHWEVNLYDSTGYGGNKIALSNVSTTSGKLFNLANYGRGGGTWDNATRSWCQGLLFSGECTGLV
jgi:hypothetical protein